MADRHFGIGCDQILLVEKPDPAGSALGADFRYRIWNADGGEVEQCGNGARCFARFVRDHGLTDKDEIRVKTLSGLGMRPLTAYATLVGLILIASVLLAQFVYREAVSFRGSWPRYEDRIGDIITAWSGPLGGAAGGGEHVPIDAGAIEPSAARTRPCR